MILMKISLQGCYLYFIVKKVVAEHCNQVLLKIIHRGKKKQRDLDGEVGGGHQRGVRIGEVEVVEWNGEQRWSREGGISKKTKSISVEWVQHYLFKRGGCCSD